MKQAWDTAFWLRAADVWLDLLLVAANRRDPGEVASALRHYDDALNEVLL